MNDIERTDLASMSRQELEELARIMQRFDFSGALGCTFA